MVQLRFAAHDGEPGPGELFLRPADAADADRRDLATLALERGLEAFSHRPGEEIGTVVVSPNPTLDDMLAADFVLELAAGREPSEGARELARYAALVREGLSPGDVPLEESVEGLFLAVRNAGGGDLSDAAVAKRFADDWFRMARVLLEAAGAGKDPFREPLFAAGSEFARERAFLDRDREVYGQDVARGERFLVQLPGGPPRASGLLLREPKSLLFKQWSRQDPAAPVGGTYLFLAVDWGDGQWVFSTDPVQRLSLKGLHDVLQAAEEKADAAAAGADPWFDGAPFLNTLVAAPKGGTRLEGRRVEALMREWLGARPVRKTQRAGGIRWTHAAAVAAAVLVVAVIVKIFDTDSPPNGLIEPEAIPRGQQVPQAERAALRSTGVDIASFAVIVGVSEEVGEWGRRLPAACPDACAVYRTLRDLHGYDESNLRLLIDVPEAEGCEGLPVFARPTRQGVDRAIEEIGELTRRYGDPSGAPAPATGRSEDATRTAFVFYYAGHGSTERGAREIGYLILSDYGVLTKGGRSRDTAGLDMAQLQWNVHKHVAATHQLLLLDNCFSGLAAVTRGTRADPQAIFEKWDREARFVITAGTSDQEALEQGGHSYFCDALLRALGPSLEADREPRDQIVTDEELATFLNEEVARRSGRKQTPTYFRGIIDQGERRGEVGQFLFFHR